jgi:hypothetical protein
MLKLCENSPLQTKKQPKIIVFYHLNLHCKYLDILRASIIKHDKIVDLRMRNTNNTRTLTFTSTLILSFLSRWGCDLCSDLFKFIIIKAVIDIVLIQLFKGASNTMKRVSGIYLFRKSNVYRYYMERKSFD